MAQAAVVNKLMRPELKQVFMPVALIGIIATLVLPLPTALLDVLLAANITISLIILFVSLFLDRALDFSSFPALLLITTLFRLSMNVATTRIILMNGDQGMGAAGHVIQAFGEYVVGGNYAIGIVIFVLISIVNLKVITKGSGRIAEVAARFTLDAMPGKQMAIDSDLNTGLIGEEEAKKKRKDLAREAEFYGSMDGAAKFVAGDAMAGVFITAINVFGGFFIGVFQKNMNWMDAAQTYTILTIGDGLVTQIPAIIISTASGLIVARAASGEDLSSEVLGQLTVSAKPLFLASAVCAGFAIVPGMPFIPFMVLSGIMGSLGYIRRSAAEKAKVDAKKAAEVAASQKGQGGEKVNPGSTEEVVKLLGLDTLELEVGYELVGLVDGRGDLIERIRTIRRQFATDYGFIVPAIHIRDNVRLASTGYRVMLRGTEIGSGDLKSRHLLAMDPGSVSTPIKGIPTKEPAFGLDALWIPEADKEKAQVAGYTVVDQSTVIATHVTELIRSHAHELLGRQEVQQLLDNVAKESPKVIEELVPGLMTVGQVQQVLASLLREQLSIRDLRTILETIADWAPTTKNVERLAEYVRRKLSRTITAKYSSAEGTLTLTNLTPNWENLLAESIQHTDEGSILSLEPTTAQQLINKFNQVAEKFVERGATPLILTSGHIRPALARFVERFVPGYAVISHQEIAPNTKVQSVGVVN
jgi:flagellar biosynthesis protein FlhA